MIGYVTMLWITMIAFRVWTAGFFIFSLVVLSRKIFSKKDQKDLAKSFIYAILWPLALFSKEGRCILFKSIKSL